MSNEYDWSAVLTPEEMRDQGTIDRHADECGDDCQHTEVDILGAERVAQIEAQR
ncbi:hypothetical protein [Nocardia carnea]|uniref:hypothetical protein n=1 Tax=Nocardia carnea TaxID=37328 RepID=UPI002457934D|nr:hypothetical protein [Nocardia carnea]